jgi:hypothetical protein
LFREWAVIIAPYDGISDPEAIELEFMPIWIQIHKIPEAYRKENVVRQLTNRQVGEVTYVEMNPSGGFRGDYVRVRVKQDVRRPLSRFVSISLAGQRSVFAVKYEKLGILCFACGLIGHTYKECGEGVYEEKDLKYGDWIHVFPGRGRGSIPIRGSGAIPGRGGFRGEPYDNSFGLHRGAGTGRGRGAPGGFGQGRGQYADWRAHPERNTGRHESDLEDTASSPIKSTDVHMSEAEKKAKKRLAFETNAEENGVTLTITNSAHTNVDLPSEDKVNEGLNEKDNKRHKREDGTSVSGNSNGSAASFEDDRRAQ